jgi:putative transposase
VCVDHVVKALRVSVRRACRGQHRSTQKRPLQGRKDEHALTRAVIALAEQYGRYGYRRITALPRAEG